MKNNFKKRKYKEIQTEQDKKFEENEKKITGKMINNKCPLQRYLKKEYYYKDENNLEWQFREKKDQMKINILYVLLQNVMLLE